MIKRLKSYLGSIVFEKEALAILLSSILLATTYSVMDEPVLEIVIFGLKELAITIPLFILFHFVIKHKIIGPIVCTVIYAAILYITMRFAVLGYIESDTGFVQWLSTAGFEVESDRIYRGLLMFGGAAFFGAVCYYFVVTRYRIALLALVSLLPCVLYAKAIADVNNWYLVLIAGMNLIISVVEHRENEETPKIIDQFGKPGVSKGFVSLAVFAAITLVIGALIPKKSEAKYYNIFEDTFLGGDTTSEVSGISEDLTFISGNADGYDASANRRLYTVYGDNVSYLKRQHFDVYDFEKGYWTPLDECIETSEDTALWNSEKSLLSLHQLKEDIAAAVSQNPALSKKYNLDRILSANSLPDPQKQLRIESNNFGATYYPVPEGTLLIEPEDGSASKVTPAGTFSRIDGKHAEDFSYTVYYRTDNSLKLGWCGLGGASYSNEEAKAFLNDIYGETSSDTVIAFEKQLDEAVWYENLTASNSENIPDDIKALAEKITNGLEYDYQKAIALYEYFHTNSYVYDLKYRPEDKSISYFIFNSKRGTCSEYATAYVLMARACGLIARYTEGYVAESAGRKGMYYIKESDSHAFPEVYIQNTGWVIFEPTSGVVENSGIGFWNNLFSFIKVDFGLARTIVIVAVVLGMIFMLIKWLIPGISELVFMIGILLGKNDARKIYLRIIKKSHKRKLKKKYSLKHDSNKASIDRSMTPSEIRDFYIAIGADISELIFLVEKYAYVDNRTDISGDVARKNLCRLYQKAMKVWRRF